MPLFGNKKKRKESLRTLSEKEIQNKLYGHLRPEGVLAPGAGHTASTLKYRLGPDSKIASQPAVPPPDIAVLPNKSIGQQERVSQWLDQESRITERKWEAEFLSPQKDKRTRVRGSIFREKILPSLLSAILFFIRLGGRFVGLLGQVFVRVIFSFDLRKPGVRRAVYWLAALGVLAGIFIAIHLLNLRREAAMKNAPRLSSSYSPSAVQKPKIFKSVLPPLTVLPIVEPRSSKEQESGGQAAEPAPSKGNENKIGGESSQASTAAALSLPTRAEVEEAASQRGFVIQVATFAIQEDAERLASKLKEEGLRSFVRSLSRTGGRVYYCVFIGGFETYREAQAILTDFRKREGAKPFKDAFIRSL